MPLYVLQLSQMKRRLRYRSIDGVVAVIAAAMLMLILASLCS